MASIEDIASDFDFDIDSLEENKKISKKNGDEEDEIRPIRPPNFENDIYKHNMWVIDSCVYNQYKPSRDNPCLSCKHGQWIATHQSVYAHCQAMNKISFFEKKKFYVTRCSKWDDQEDKKED